MNTACVDHERSHETLYACLMMPFQPWTTPGPHTDPPVTRTDRPGSPSHRAVTAHQSMYSQQSLAGAEFRLREPRHAKRAQAARPHAPHACWRSTRARQHSLRPPTRALMHLHTRKRQARRGSDTAGKGGNGPDSRRRGGGTPSKPPSGCPEGTPSGADATRPPPIDRSVHGGLSAA